MSGRFREPGDPRPRTTMLTARRRPDFIGIGAQKAASTWLSKHLARHPGVWTPFLKEFHLFDATAPRQRAFWIRTHSDKMRRLIAKVEAREGPKPRSERMKRLLEPDWMMTLDWYLAIFGAGPPGRLAGEFTPSYSALSDRAVGAMTAALPETKFIYLVRDPLARALSAFRMSAERGVRDLEDGERLSARAKLWFGRRGHVLGDYADFIPRWDARCEEGARILYLPFGRVAADPRGVMRDVEAFLGLRRHDGYVGLETPRHATADAPVPDWVRARLEAHAAPHRAFLERRFDAKFVAAL